MSISGKNINCRFCQFRKRKSQTTRKMTMCHSIELIRYRIQAHWQNNCTVLITKDQSSKVCQHFFIFGLVIFLINLSSSSSKECAMGVALKIATGKILQILKIPTHFCFTTSKERSGQISQKSAEFWYPINSFV